MFDSNRGFTLPNGAVRAPDASWVLKIRWNRLPKEDRERFAHICPDFVVELKSPFHSVPFLQDKMQEYIENGARLGWLIDPDQKQVHVYRPNRVVEVQKDQSSVSTDPVLPAFTLHLNEL